MFKGTKVLDVHGHVSAPTAARNFIVGGFHSGSAPQNPFRRTGGGGGGQGGGGGEGGGGGMGAINRAGGGNDLGDEAFQRTNQAHVDYMDERSIDVQVIGPRPYTMMGWMPRNLLPVWCEFTNDTIHKQVQNFPTRFVGAAMLPQIAEAPDLKNCLPELEKCVKEYGFGGVYLSPDPNGKHDSPGMNTEYWYPVYEKCQEWNVPVFIHGTNCLDPRISHIPGNYQVGFVVETFLASRILAYSDLFDRFPALRICIAHAGGALDRFIDTAGHRGRRDKDQSNNLFFDTCAYNADYLELAIKQWGVNQMCFGTEAPGSGGAVRPENGLSSDHLLPIIDAFTSLSEDDKVTIINKNPAKVFPALAKV